MLEIWQIVRLLNDEKMACLSLTPCKLSLLPNKRLGKYEIPGARCYSSRKFVTFASNSVKPENETGPAATSAEVEADTLQKPTADVLLEKEISKVSW